jgi:hypothetical protein
MRCYFFAGRISALWPCTSPRSSWSAPKSAVFARTSPAALLSPLDKADVLHSIHQIISNMFAARWPSPLATLLLHAPRPSSTPSSLLRQRTLCTSTPTYTPRSTSFLNSYRTALALALPTVALGVGLSSKEVECAGDRSYATPAPPTVVGGTPAAPTEAESIINLRDLSFGTVSGICVGICELSLRRAHSGAFR